MLSVIYYFFIIIIVWMSYIFITGFIPKGISEECMALVKTKCDLYTFAIVLGLFDGPSMYAEKVGNLFCNSWFQVLAFWAGSIAGIYLGPIEYYKSLSLHQCVNNLFVEDGL